MVIIFTMWGCKFYTVSKINGSTAPASDGDSCAPGYHPAGTHECFVEQDYVYEYDATIQGNQYNSI